MQGKDVDVLAAKRTADLTLAVLEKCRNDKNFSLLWMKTESLADEIQQWLEESEFTYKEITGPRRKPSRRHQALVGEKMGDGDMVTPDPAKHHKVDTYFVSLDRVISELRSRFQGNEHQVL